MLRQGFALIMIAAGFTLGTGCTGGANTVATGENGSIKIAPGGKLTVDLSDVRALNVDEFTVTIRAVKDDYSLGGTLLDLTSMVTASGNASQFTFVLPKSLINGRPFLVVADIPSLNTQLTDVIYDSDSYTKPGIASSLTYVLLKNYPGKSLKNYSGPAYHGIQALIQTRMDELLADSDYLSLATTDYKKVIRYFTNGVAFNPTFLTAIQQYGVNYTWSLTTPNSITVNDIPPGDQLSDYQYATSFLINGAPADVNPFAQTNNPPMLMPGASLPNPGTGLFLPEGKKVSVVTQGFDIDDDYIDKNMIVQYIPRVLPTVLTSVAGFPVIPEPTPQYTTITQMTGPAGTDSYASDPIGYNEALDLAVYPTTLSYDPSLYPDPNIQTPDTAYRNIYYLISDGMVRVPYRWNFKYSDINRQPVIVRNAQGKMNDSELDTILAPGETETYPGTGWLKHGSHCESDDTATYQYTDPVSGLPAFAYYQVIKDKSESPWSCVFRMTDPDIDDDPNAAGDTFYYSVNMSDNSTIVRFGDAFTKIWPVYDGPPYVPDRYLGTTIQNCVTPDGKTHPRCGRGLYQITIDNSVKAAAEGKSNLSYAYDVVVYDRSAAIGGASTSQTISRTIQIPAQPARLLNYSGAVAPSGTLGLDLLTNNAGGAKIYFRQDTYLNELMDRADPGHSLNYDFSGIGFGNGVQSSILAGDANRGNFFAGTPQVMSPYITQPFHITGGQVTLDPVTRSALTASPGAVELLGSDITTNSTSTYSVPHEYDSSCQMPSNNQNSVEGWTQTGLAEGWSFEIDAIDYDNVALAVGEASDPVHITLSADVNLAINGSGFQFCGYKQPNSDPAYYQTYQATQTLPVVNADACTWTGTLPADMQPIPVYYTTTVNGATVVQKFVYHRLRFKWQPKDQGLTNGKTIVDPAGYIKNLIRSGLQTTGNRFALLSDAMDQNTVTSTIPFLAKRKDMAPCLTGLKGTNKDVLHQLNTTLPINIKFSVSDENKVLPATPTVAGATMGRFESELTLMGSRAITNTEFLKWIPYALNCTYEDKAYPVGTTAPLVKAISEPLIWYTRASDTNNTPRIRFQSVTDPVASQFCMNFNYTPLVNTAGVQYNEVILIQNLSASPWVLKSSDHSFLASCTARTSINVNPDEKYIAIASTCGGLHTTGQSLWSDSFSAAQVQYIADPTALSNGGYAAGTNMSLDMFPSMYQAETISTFPSGYDAPNGLFFSASVFDTFRIDPVLGVPVYTGYKDSSNNAIWLANQAPNAIPVSTPVAFPAASDDYGIQVVDWDNQPVFMSLATPTPNAATSNFFFRKAPGDSNRIQVYVKNHATVTFPIAASDSSTGQDLDAFDIMQFALVAPAATPASTPTFTGIGRSTCRDAPAGYPNTLSGLNIPALATYKTCSFSWTPSASDDGQKYSYTFDVQDNYLSTWNGGTSTAWGAGARHPAGASAQAIVLSDSSTRLNGPAVTYSIDIEAIETNVAPFFTSATGTTITAPYNPAGGSAGWSNVFSTSAPSGIATPCTSSQSAAAQDMTHTAFPCDLSVSSGDTLQSDSTIQMYEGSQQTFSIYAKDSNVTAALKTLTAAKPTKVFIVDGPHAGRTYTVPSFSTMSMSANPNVTNGTATFTFSWTPTDSEANFLSNPGGFLIPVTVSDQAYYAGSDSGFPSSFVVPAMNNTVWIWAKLSVKNTQPSVYYLMPAGCSTAANCSSTSNCCTTEVPLAGSTLTLQTGKSTKYTIRIKDIDIARWTQTGNYSDFTPSYTGFTGASGASFTTAAPASTPYYSSPYIVQEFSITGAPSANDIGIYSAPVVGVVDPGDPSLGLAVNPDSSSPPKSQVFATTNAFTNPFNFQVIGKPLFLVPSGTPSQSQAYVYSSKPFVYPLSMFISRPSEMLQSFFIGIDSSTTVTPLRTTLSGAGSTGIYIDEKSILRWPDSTVLNITGNDRVVPVYGVMKSYCNAALSAGATAKTLVRYNVAGAAIETCKLSADTVVSGVTTPGDFTNNASQLANVTLTLVDNANLSPTPPPITMTELDRTYTPATAPADFTNAVDRQFSDFYARCTNCVNSPTYVGAGTMTQNMSTTAYQLNATPGIDSSITYNYANYVSRMEVKNASGFTVNKIYQDTTPTTVRSLNVIASKGESLTFKAQTGGTPASPYYQYRWFVNGCLKSTGFVDGSTISYNMKITSLMSGINNDCTGEYGFAEANSTALGKLVIRLAIENGTEAISSTTEASSVYYLWNVSVLNSDPNVITTNSYTPSNPITFDSNYMSGTANIQYAMPISYANKNFLAFTDLNASTGLKIRLREFDAAGTLPSTGANMNLTCDASFNLAPVWMGLQPLSNGGLAIAASINNSYPTGSTAGLVYGQKSSTCYTNALTLAAPNANFTSYTSSTTPAGYLAFSKYSMANRAIASFTTNSAGTVYTPPSYDSSFFLIDGSQATSTFWSYNLTDMVATAPPALSPPYSNNVVRKDIVSGTKLFQLIGANTNNATGWRGWVLTSNLAQNGSPSNQVNATPLNSIMFGDATAANPSATVNDCNFNGTPLDAQYVATTDTLYVLAESTDSTGKGHMVAIQKISTSSPSCRTIGDVLNPTLTASDHNPNISKMSFDSTTGMIFGVINQGQNQTSQFYVYDIYNQNLVTRDLSATLSAYELISVPAINATYLFDNRKTVSGTIYTPMLYKIW